MKETGILFTPENHRSIRDGRKTQTRRIIKPQPIQSDYWTYSNGAFYPNKYESQPKIITCRYGQLGDKLYVKEGTWMWCDAVPNGTKKTVNPKIRYVPVGQHVHYCLGGNKPHFNIDDNPRHCWKHKTAMFMPKWAARTWLELTDVRVERVQDISEEDAKAEGVEQTSKTIWRNYFEDVALYSAKHSFSSLWQSIDGKNKPGGEWDAWDSNPFVFALSFRVI